MTTMTKLAFKAAYAHVLRSMGPARDDEEVMRSLKRLDRALAGEGDWDQAGIATAWVAIGGKGEPSLEALRALPDGEGRPPEFN